MPLLSVSGDQASKRERETESEKQKIQQDQIFVLPRNAAPLSTAAWWIGHCVLSRQGLASCRHRTAAKLSSPPFKRGASPFPVLSRAGCRPCRSRYRNLPIGMCALKQRGNRYSSSRNRTGKIKCVWAGQVLRKKDNRWPTVVGYN